MMIKRFILGVKIFMMKNLIILMMHVSFFIKIRHGNATLESGKNVKMNLNQI